MTEAENFHEQLMAKAYVKWQGKGWTTKQFYFNLDKLERDAVILGNLNYQVENGGFMQWHDNKYGGAARDFIVDLLADIGTSTAKKVSELVVESYKINDGLEKLLNSCNYEDDDENFAEFDGKSNELDKKYYKLNEKFMADCLKYLTKKAK